MEKAQKIKTYVLLHVLMLIFSLSPVCSKLAGQQPFLSFKFVLFYGLVILLLGIYALLWQQIIKRMPLTTAYANKAVTVVWGMVWGALLFQEDITLEEPVIIKQGGKYGVKIHSEAPSIHLIRANIETEIAPIVGSEQQAQDLITYIHDRKDSEGGIWSTNIFGKSVEELVMDGMRNKMAMIGDESQVKLQDTMQKIVNDSNGGMVCIII